MRDEETVEPKGTHTRHAKGGIRHAFGETGGSIGGHTRRTNGEQGLLRLAEKEGAMFREQAANMADREATMVLVERTGLLEVEDEVEQSRQGR